MKLAVLAVFIAFCVAHTFADGGYHCREGLAANNNSVCLNGGTCNNITGTSTTNSYTSCNCINGWQGPFCSYKHITDCQGNSVPDVFQGDGICHQKGQYAYGSDGVDLNCAALNYDDGDCGAATTPANTHAACNPNPCGTGRCYGSNTKYWCSCPRNSDGANCEIVKIGCTGAQCLNGGVCVNDLRNTNNYRCVCPVGYLQPSCTPFPSIPCPACVHGSCNGFGGCSCTGTGYFGPLCETLNTACASNPCQNGATCVTSSSSFRYSCRCATNYFGTNCEHHDVSCSSNPCQNGGVCTNGGTFNGASWSYSCTCTSGYFGTNCQTKVDACFPEPCLNLGTEGRCTFGFPYTCSCATNYFTRNCTFGLPADAYDCSSFFAPQAYPVSQRGDGVCQQHWTYIKSATAVGRYVMASTNVDGSGSGGTTSSFITCSATFGDSDCTSEQERGSGTVLSASLVLIAALMFLLI